LRFAGNGDTVLTQRSADPAMFVVAGYRVDLRPENEMNRMFGCATTLLILGAVNGAALHAQETPVQRSEHHAFRIVTVAADLQNPWSMVWLPNGDMLLTERPGRLRIIRNGALLPDPVPGVPEVRARGQGGLLDLALHPDFANNRLLYISYSKPNAEGLGTTAVVRGRFENDRLTNVQEIFEAKAWSNGGDHFGSRLVFDRNGFLFITVGDRAVTPRGNLEAHPAQDLSNHQGTVIRLHDDGRVPADNPFVDRPGAQPEIWSYGHRNLQVLAIHPETGDLWENEHGAQGGDELNLVQPGRNYGWPVIGMGVNYGGATIHASSHREGMEQPVHYWIPSIATSGLLIYMGDRFPAWQGSFFVGGLAGEQLARITMDGRRAANVEVVLRGVVGRIRDVRQGPDGYIYLAIDDRRGGRTPILRLEPVAGNHD
jgi:glucose/arabinose dehydrogenase